MQDHLLHAVLMGGQARVLMASTTALTEQARLIHNTSQVCTAALGRTLTATVLMGAMLKSDTDRITLNVVGGGPAGRVVCVGWADGAVKGYVENPGVQLPPRADGKLDVGAVIGSIGRLTVVKDLGMKEPYVGQCNLVSGEIGEDVAMYFTVSEQTPSLVSLGVLVAAQGPVLSCGGLVVQAMPGCSEEVLGALEAKSATMADISRQLLTVDTLEEMFMRLFADEEPEILTLGKPVWRCDCDRERIERALISLGEKELTDMIIEDGKAQISCHFCGHHYNFTAQELEGLRSESIRREK